MTQKISAKEVASRLGMTHLEVIRRIRRGDIRAEKWAGWVWTIKASEVERVKKADWYRRLQARRA